MTDNITLPRADAEQIRAALVSGEKLFAALSALAAALAEPESDAQCPTCGGGGLVPDPTWDWVRCDVCNPLPEKPEPPVKESLTTNHIRSIWLDSWKACGNVPTPVLAEHFARQIERALAALAEPDAKPEPATEEQIIHSWPTELPYLSAHNAFYKGFRAAERFHGITKEDK